MTIKRRLFISNILMIVIPFITSLAIAFAAMYLLLQGPVFDGDGKYFNARYRLTDLTQKLLEANDETGKKAALSALEDILHENKMALRIFLSGKQQYSLGNYNAQDTDKLLKAVLALGNEGIASVENQEIYAKPVLVNGQNYIICIINARNHLDLQQFMEARRYTAVFMPFGILIVILLTNQFLTRFVFRKIAEPLQILANGVHQIRDGNLDYRIHYSGRDEFAHVCEDFNDMAAQLKASVELIQKQEQNRKELLASISHDIRSPLTSIKAYSEGLLDGVARTADSQKSYVTMIKTKTEDIDRMVAKLFLFSKMDLGEFPYTPEKLDLAWEIRSLMAATVEEYDKKGLKIRTERLAEGVEIFADPVQIYSVLTNILENSLKYKNKEQGLVTIRSEIHENEVLIIIEDDGPGVPDEALPKLFDVFYRNDPARHNPNMGSGLGLAITAKAVDRMGGSIHAEHGSLDGLRLVIKLPVQKKE